MAREGRIGLFSLILLNPKGTEEKATLKGTTGMAHLRGSAR
jgi:hypothetical protein